MCIYNDPSYGETRIMFTLVTYNLHLCQDQNKLIKNIVMLVREKHASIICLQEVVHHPDQAYIVSLLLEKLGNSWRSIDHVGTESHG